MRRGAPSAVDLSAVDPRVVALALRMRRGQFWSRRTAAALHGMPVSDRDDRRLEMGAVRPSRPLRRPETAGHQLRPGTLERVPDRPPWLPSVVDAWCLLAQVATREELLAAGDWIVSGPGRYDPPAATPAALAAAVRRFRGTHGSLLRAEVLPLVRCGAESPAESRLRLALLDGGLPEPVIQCPVPVRGRTLRADLGYPDLRIAIEHEGAHHFVGGDALRQARVDVTRVRAMEDAGWTVIRVTAHDLRHPAELIRILTARIAQATAARNAR